MARLPTRAQIRAEVGRIEKRTFDEVCDMIQVIARATGGSIQHASVTTLLWSLGLEYEDAAEASHRLLDIVDGIEARE